MVGNKEKAPKTYVTDLLTGILNRNVLKDVTHVENVKLADDGRSIVILDQSALPNRTEYLTLQALPEFYDAIFTLKVRGAPCIGIFAGYAMSVLARQIAGELELSGTVSSEKWRSFINRLSELGEELNSSRPTAVNLSYAIKRMLAKAESLVAETNCSAEGLLDELQREATAIHEEDIEMCRKIAEAGLTLIKDGDGILTHCNAGPLATSRYGTALGPILLGKERGLEFHVFADETRPLLQGARLTSYELSKAGVDVTLICDNMASIVMKSGKVQACFVGCDRVAANGDAANKIGTSGVAILAKHYGIP
ncbi:MAG: S-methyl-5-thioribose-1-phosphate isomerase, partial [Firmicutes bacterium]|nr:S-methyl-5-thioribose-1-phosphate isomerase [Bacillota bacterium]